VRDKNDFLASLPTGPTFFLSFFLSFFQSASTDHALHSGGARFEGNVGASDGDGPAPGAGNDEAVLLAAKHSQVIDPACTEPFVRTVRAVGVSALSGAEGTSTSTFDPAGATRVEYAMVICPLSSST
jgi:hypothetical protein